MSDIKIFNSFILIYLIYSTVYFKRDGTGLEKDRKSYTDKYRLLKLDYDEHIKFQPYVKYRFTETSTLQELC